MPRLIDADAYAAEMRKRQENCRAWKDSLDRESETYARAEQSFATFVEAALTLKKQPTVDAIPVGWLKQWRDKLNGMGEYQRERAEDISFVLGLWQKEQEATPFRP